MVPRMLLLWPLLGLSACQAAAPEAVDSRVQRRLGAMGTWLELEVAAPTRAEALAASEVAVRAIEAVEARLSTWTDDSELAHLNRAPAGQPCALSPALMADLERARALCAVTGGAFDPGVGELVAAWGLRSGGRRPTDEEIADALATGGMATLVLTGDHAVRPAGLRLEEGAFGKGVALDAACEQLANTAATWASIDLGGQIRLFGGGEALRYGVADPRDRERVVLDVDVEHGSLATTGNSERGIVVDGVRMSHILDPRTGSPAPDFGSVTVWAADATTADAFSTALYVLGPDAALSWAARHPEVEALVLRVADGGRLVAHATEGWRERLQPRVDDIDVITRNDSR